MDLVSEILLLLLELLNLFQIYLTRHQALKILLLEMQVGHYLISAEVDQLQTFEKSRELFHLLLGSQLRTNLRRLLATFAGPCLIFQMVENHVSHYCLMLVFSQEQYNYQSMRYQQFQSHVFEQQVIFLQVMTKKHRQLLMQEHFKL